MTDHLKEARKGNDSKVYRAIRKYNITRNNFEIIENDIPNKELADEREIYWIKKYNSFKNGYNSTAGGDVGNNGILKGENSPKAIFTNLEVLEIRKIKASMKFSKEEVYSKYSNRISKSGFGKIWNYETYTDIAPELNTPEIIDFYKHKKVSGIRNKRNKFTKEQVIEIRNKYYIDAISSSNLASEYEVNKTCIQRIVTGKTYSDVPLPSPSLTFRRKNHIFTDKEIDIFIENFISSKLNISDYL